VSTIEEHLTTGWEPGAPTGDTLLRRFLFHHAAAATAFACSAGGTAVETPGFLASDARRPSGFWNAAVLVAPPADWEVVLDEVEAFFAGGTGTVGLWSAWPTPDLRDRGWRLSGHPPLLVRPPAAVLPVPATPAPAVARVATPAELAVWERVAIDGYPLPDLEGAGPGAMAGRALLDDPRLRLYTAHVDGEPVSAAASFTDFDLLSLAFGATRPEARRRGLWQQLATTRLRDAPDLWAAGVFSDFSRPGAEALGFVPVLRFTLWLLDRTKEKD
jgi:hypothetical protein